MSKRLLNVTDWGFLDDLAEYKVSAEDLKHIFNDEVGEIIDVDPEISDDDLLESAKEALRATLVKNKRGGTTKGRGFNIGAGDLNDYCGRWNKSQLKAFENLGQKDAKAQKLYDKFYKNQKEMLDAGLIRIDKVKKGDKEVKVVVALDHRAKSHAGNENKKYQKPYPAHTFMSNFYTIWKPEAGGEYKIVTTTLGGEPNDEGGFLRDSSVSPLCPKCGKRSLTIECKNKNDKKTPCNGQKVYQKKTGEIFARFLIPDIMKSVGKQTKFPLTIKTNDKGVTTAIYLDQNVDFDNPVDVPIKMDRDPTTKQKTLGGEFGAILMKFPDRFVTSKEIFDTWSKDKAFLHAPSRDWWKKHHETVYGRENGKLVFFIAYIVDIGDSMKYGKCIVLAEDPAIPGVKRDKLDEGTTLNTPEHVHEYNVKGVFGEKSLVLVAGTINRMQGWEKDDKGKKTGMKTIKIKDSKTKAEIYMPVYDRPSIDVVGMIPIGTPRPPKAEKPHVDLGEDNEPIVVQAEEFTDKELEGATIGEKEPVKSEEEKMDFEDPSEEVEEKKAPEEPEEGKVSEATGEAQEPTATEEEIFFK